jgi:hypothetical protein
LTVRIDPLTCRLTAKSRPLEQLQVPDLNDLRPLWFRVERTIT